MIKHVALGFFDGVHLGHGALLRRTAEAAAQSGGRACALTFDVHPQKQISGFEPPLLTTVNDRAALMRRLYGIEEIIILPFNEVLMRMSWREFIGELLVDEYGAGHIIIGHDYHFGFRGQGNGERLRAVTGDWGIGCDIVERFELDGITVSSTYIRGLVAQGDMERAALFLGHPHIITGRVVAGRQLGGSIGYPTANLPVPPGIITPAHGVYASRVRVDGILWAAMTNIGVRPTVTDRGEVSVETTILDYKDRLYGKEIQVELLCHVREERAFVSLEALAGQIRMDEAQIRRYHAEHPR